MASISNDTWCSQQADSSFMGGTAEHVDVWLLLEYSNSWKPKANEDNSLSGTVNDWLGESVTALNSKGVRARPQFIRQPDKVSSALNFIVATKAGVWCFKAMVYEDFLTLDVASFVNHLEANTTDAVSAASLPCEELLEPHHFVCMNGQRDRCCARFGRPVYERLQQLGANVWHISHLGGHRFAPNILCLPQSAVYGRLEEADLSDYLATTTKGDLYFPALRGRSWYPKIVQAGEALLATQGLQWQVPADNEISNDQATLQFSGSTEQSAEQVTVQRVEQAKPLLASCGASAPKTVYAFERVTSGL